MKSDFVVSIHIPKTAGTTLSYVLSRCYNRRIIFDYDGYNNPSKASNEIIESKEFISKYFFVLHGHFYAKKYFDVFPEAKFIATVRHPVERVISQYNHELNEHSSDAWYHQDIASGRMDIATFAEQAGVGDAMTIHLAGKPLKDYSLILVSEQLRLSLSLFDKFVRPLNIVEYFGRPAVLPIENAKGARHRIVEVDDTKRNAIFDRTKSDNDLYAEATQLLVNKASSLP